MKWTDSPMSYRSALTRARKMDPFELLEVSRDSSAQEIRRAYLSMVKTYHPDRSHPFMRVNNEEMLKIINDAYQHLLRLTRDAQ